jgi:outer membrane protein OmpA-like peptidoglycan-associated protein
MSGVEPALASVTFIDHVPTAAEIAAAWRTPVAQAAGPAGPLGPAPSQTQKFRGVQWQDPQPVQAEPTQAESLQDPARIRWQDPGGDDRPALAFPVHFDSGAVRVSRPSLAYVAALAAALGQDPRLRIQVEGHTDSAGSPRSNLMLSWERAFAVFRLLVERYGIDPARLVPVGKGCSEPLVATESPHPLNRRVQFRVMSS